ncbi:MAG: M15 family metallopeptidase [Treponema sp.]|nr:M15 family metallopeptidase [Treponema sp.]
MEEKIIDPMDSRGFVLLSDYVSGIIQEIRYFSSYNFIGERITGYEEPCAIVTQEAARALQNVAAELNAQGFRLKIYDAYRPASAVKHFALWGVDDLDQRMKPFFYPDLEKQELFEKGYIAKRSSHSRGSTVDLTLFDMNSGKEVDMGSPFDLFSQVSHPDYKGISDEQYENRLFLKKTMVKGGFDTLDCEWWHFTLHGEPYPDSYFDFPVSSKVLNHS